MPRKVDAKGERRKFNQALELAQQKEKITNQREEILKLKRAIKARDEALSTQIRRK
jgi:hypothetical protein